MIEEYARHNGHADLLRERIDGVTGARWGGVGGEPSTQRRGRAIMRILADICVIPYWLIPVMYWKDRKTEKVIRDLVQRESIYALSEKSHRRRYLQSGDWICFYIPCRGVVTHAKLATRPERKRHRAVPNPEKYPWVFHLEETRVYIEEPVALDITIRGQLDAFRDRDLKQLWS
jgi:hypothetical protein